MKKVLFGLSVALVTIACVQEANWDVNKDLAYCRKQALWTLDQIGDTALIPRNIMHDESSWNLRPAVIEEWTAGFWPGTLWYVYESSKDDRIKQSAIHYTELLESFVQRPAYDHDLGFQIFCSYGNAYRLTGNEDYKQIILNAADTLATLFNPKVGTLLSWPREVDNGRFAPYNTIMDNMINLEVLYWAAKNGGNKSLYDVATAHAATTMQHHFREDGSSYHVALYDPVTGQFIKGLTHQGYADGSMWARGQAWAIYGYTMVYRETRDVKFLRFAEKVTDIYLKRLPADYIPYWDFDAPNIPNEPKDASAAAVTASALLELSQLEDDVSKAQEYKEAAIKMLQSLSSETYQSRLSKPSFLLHSVGHKPAGSEIDASINYADYYYIEALIRYEKLKRGESVLFTNLKKDL